MKVFSDNSNISLRHLKAAVMVRAEGSFSRAAQRLGVVPSALTDAVQALEAECGTAIFDRRTRPIRPTAAGEAFLQEIEFVLEKLGRSVQDLRQVGGAQRGKLAIGAAPSAVLDPLAGAINRFRSAFPAIELIIHDDVADRLAGMVAERQLDFAIAGPGVMSSDLDQRLLSTDPFGLVCHVEHRLVRLDRELTLADIDPAELIALEGQTGIARLLRDSAELPDTFRGGTIRTFSTIAQLTLISLGAGIALLPKRAVGIVQSQSLVFRMVTDLNLTRDLYVLTAKRQTSSRAALEFLRLL